MERRHTKPKSCTNAHTSLPRSTIVSVRACGHIHSQTFTCTGKHPHTQLRMRKYKEGRTCSRSPICVWQHARVCVQQKPFYWADCLAVTEGFDFPLVWQKWLMAVPLSVKDPRTLEQEAMCSKSRYYRPASNPGTNIQLIQVVKGWEQFFWTKLANSRFAVPRFIFLHFTIFVLKHLSVFCPELCSWQSGTASAKQQLWDMETHH